MAARRVRMVRVPRRDRRSRTVDDHEGSGVKTMKTVLTIGAWTFRGSALICMIWIVSQVFGGQIASVPVLLSSVAFHAVFAIVGVQLAGFARGRDAAVERELPGQAG